ncbi:CorA family divalent cation transporter [Ruminococcus gauvreauii]|uniref:Uncharacterized protein n=2 Tax=Ruminococcus gauvreauii TaxID=438033 RepID=A0ABY5VMJ7_9FIRM|nr:CorA family divalent cation transporter [Ruminococcus gauvreauii]UWP61333.1 hypothetical protein NQ502_01965 [Ruminococcus gauvreauii]
MNVNNFVCEPDLDLSTIDRNEENLIIVDRKNLIKVERYIGFPLEKVLADSDEFPVIFNSGDGYDSFSFVFLDGNQMNMDFEKISLILMEKLLVIVINSQSLHRMAKSEFVEEFVSGSTTTMYMTFMELIFYEMSGQLREYEAHLYYMRSQLITGGREYRIGEIIHEREMCLTLKKYTRQLLLSREALKRNSNNLIPEKEMRILPNICAKIGLLSEIADHLTELSAHLMELYRSTVSTKSFHAFYKLTVFSFFATPMIVLSGIYGINFINRLELLRPFGFFLVLGVTLGISSIIFLLLKKCFYKQNLS